MSPESNTCISKNLKQFWSEIRPSVIRWIANIGKFFGLRDTDFANYLPFFFRFFQAPVTSTTLLRASSDAKSR